MANGLIAGAFKGLADAAGGLAQGYIEDERKLNYQQQLSAMEEQRQMRIEQYRQKLGLDTRQKEFEQDIANAPRKTAANVANTRATKQAELDIEREDTVKRGADPDYLKGKKALVNAGRADPQYSPDTLANAELTRIKVKDEQRRRQLLDERTQVEEGNLRGDQRERAIKRIDRELAALAGITNKKPMDETDTEKVIEKKYDEMGNVVTQTERVEKRKAKPGESNKDRAGEREAHDEARAAIAKGAPREAVNKRLRELGFSPI